MSLVRPAAIKQNKTHTQTQASSVHIVTPTCYIVEVVEGHETPVPLVVS